MIIRSLLPDDDEAIRRIFLTTLFLGAPAPFRLAWAREYTDLCLGWYLTTGRADAAVAIDESGRVVGYALVSTDTRSHRRASTRAGMRFIARTARAAAIGRLDAENRRFYTGRARDACALWSAGRAAPMPIHAHLNVDSSVRSGGAALRLRAHIDQRALTAGASGWWGEINAEVGQREVGLARLGLSVVRRRPSRTLTAVIQRPVVRLTVVRRLQDEPLTASRYAEMLGTDPP